MAGETVTEEEIRDMEARRAWEAALAPVQRRVDVARGDSIDVNALPNAPPRSEELPPENFGPPTREELVKYGAKPAEQEVALRANDPDASGALTNPNRAPERAPEPAPEKPVEKKEDAPAHEEEPGGHASGPSSPGVVIPGGMSPFTEKREVKHGKVVAPGVREAIGKAGHLGLEAGARERDANAALHQHEQEAAIARMHAGETAMAAQARLQEERDRIVGARLAEIETLNKKAQGNPEDLWSARHVLGRIIGFLSLTLGTVQMATGGKGGVASGITLAMGGKFIDGLINQDIQSKIDERRQAGKAAGRQINLLHLHEERFKNQAKAIDATKLAYYDNVLQQMDAYKAEHAGEVNEANYVNLQKQILTEQGEIANRLGKQEQADVTDELVNKYRPPQVAGGGGGAIKDIPNKVRLSDGTTYALDTEKIQGTALAEIHLRQNLQANSQEVLRERAKLAKENPLPGSEAYQTGIAKLNQLQKERMDIYSVASGQGVNTKADVEREEKYGTMATSGFGKLQTAGKAAVSYSPWTDAERHAADAVFRRDIERQDEYQRRMMESHNGRIVSTGFNRDPVTGELSPVARETGKRASPKPALPPAGSTPRGDSGIREYPTAPAKSVEATTPKSPILSRRPTDLPTPSSHHSRKKKK